MAKSATDLMQEILFSTVLDSIVALKDASNGLPNPLLRELNSIHPNTTYADLPKEVQSAIATNVRSAFTRLLKEGYSVAPQGAEPAVTSLPWCSCESRSPGPQAVPVVALGSCFRRSTGLFSRGRVDLARASPTQR